MNNSKHNYTRKGKRALRTLTLFMIDILLTAAIICTFALFHHVLPKYEARKQADQYDYENAINSVKSTDEKQNSDNGTENVEETDSEDNLESHDKLDPAEITTAQEGEIITEEPINVDNRTAWQIQFEDKFTDDVIQTDTTYSSPNVSISISKLRESYGGYPVNYYLADIYVGDISCFKTGAAYDEVLGDTVEKPVKLDSRLDALLMVNGDYTSSRGGLLVRNGEVYLEKQTSEDICVLTYDGVMKTYTADSYQVEDILNQNPYQVWRFGPQLLDSEGNVCTEFNTTWSILTYNPRCAIGYYEPGHYCFLVAEGRLQDSRGLTMQDMAQIFHDLGCKAAYNLDGGASAVMTFNDKMVNIQTDDRWLRDVLYICELPLSNNDTSEEVNE